MPEAAVATTGTATAVVTPPAAVTTEDILKRSVASVISTTDNGIDPFEVAGFNRNDVNKITDPVARQYVENLEKSLKSGFHKKMNELNERIQVVEKEKKQGWTPERVEQIYADPTFQSAAKSFLSTRSGAGSTRDGGGPSDDEMSFLTDDERGELKRTQNAANAALNTAMQIQSQQEDQLLAQRYGSHYDSKQVTQIQEDLLANRVVATREHLWKVVDYDSAVKRAYELGRNDERGGITEKHSASTAGGTTTVTSSEDVPAKNQGESTPAYFTRLAQWRMGQMKDKLAGARR